MYRLDRSHDTATQNNGHLSYQISRMESEYAYHHICITQGEPINHNLLKSTKSTIKHLRERREDPINQTCFHCSVRKLAEYRSAKDSIDFDPVHFLNNTTQFEKDHPHRGDALRQAMI